MKGKDVILGLLTKRSRSGYEINEVFGSVFSHFFDGTYGMIYPTLKSLEKEDLIKKEHQLQIGKPNKNNYTITEKGIAEFFTYLNSAVQKDVVKSDFLMRMYFGEYLEHDKILDIINQEIVTKEFFLEQLQNDYKKWQNNLTLTQQISFDIGIAQYTAEIKVLKKYTEIIKKEYDERSNTLQ